VVGALGKVPKHATPGFEGGLVCYAQLVRVCIKGKHSSERLDACQIMKLFGARIPERGKTVLRKH
jgi:hypothetical protein